jgi:hypothetical protein
MSRRRRTGYSGSYTGGFKTDYSLAMDNQDGNIAETDAYGQGLVDSAHGRSTTDAHPPRPDRRQQCLPEPRLHLLPAEHARDPEEQHLTRN